MLLSRCLGIGACYDLRRHHSASMQVNQREARHISPYYRPDVDGLRAIAVVSVMLGHAGVAAFNGGFTGVDIFFAISGFVVATSILGDLYEGNFSFREFYARRAKRLAPALFVMMAALFIFSILFSLPTDSYHLAKNILAVATMTSNIFLSKQTGYFDANAADQPLLHTWSLSVEEQFYVFLPLLLYWVHRKWSAWLKSVVFVIAAFSFAIALIASYRGTTGAYYFAQYRAFEFLVGVLLALHEFRREVKKGLLYDWLFALGFLAIVASSHASDMQQFPGIGAVAPCGGAILLIFAGRRSTVLHALFANRVAVFIGRISYPLYLWHWPLYYSLRKLDLASQTGYVIATGITFVLATLTYRCIEQPIRRAVWPVRRTLIGLVGIPLLACGALTATGKVTDGFLFAYPEKVRNDFRWSGDAVFDMPRGKVCWSKVGVTDETTCQLGAVGSRQKAILWGDSHAYHLIYFFDELGKAHNLSIHDVGFTLCPPIENEPAKPADNALLESHLQCVQHNKDVMAFAMERSDVQTVFMAAAWQNYQNNSTSPTPNGHGFLPGQLEAELVNTISRLQEAGKRVVLMDDVPMIPMNLINCDFNNNLYFTVRRQACEFDARLAREQHAPIEAMLNRIKRRFPQIGIMHTYDVPCTEKTCTLDFDGRPIYRFDDYHHLSAAGSMLLYPKYMERHPQELEAILAR
ncbi:acyltransferase family protein (plasmid) [Burkholderia aenigmatica]|uniref:acyltransferase family protein n=1 Tax=Burkholderia aenigmatica TaxID=2015348 RepID=UPI003B439705